MAESSAQRGFGGKTIGHSPLPTPIDRVFLEDLNARYDAAWNAKDIEAFLALHTEDCVWETPFIHPHGIARGHAEMHAETHALFLSLDGTRAAQQWTIRARLVAAIDPPGYAPTNRPIVMHGVSVWELDGERLSRVTEYVDGVAVARQIGLLPQPETIGERLGVLGQRLAAWRMRRRGR